MIIDPKKITPQETYKLLIGGITPRPIAWVSSISSEGIVNLAPFSFYTVASANPPVLCFNPMYNNDAEAKDTLRNIREQREFVINSVSAKDLETMNMTCHDLPFEQNEFQYASVEPANSSLIRPPRIKDAVVSYECRLNQIVDLGDDALSGHLILGNVVAIHVQDSAFDNYRISSDELDSIGRMSGNDYSRTRDRIQLSRK
ncbi:flavin reductase family protein [Vibrio sp. SS-MA-C1-2]|uniref:flavin reductase family protein n=1 Tax=Vibrio sp. SS-MA-C1-2 TaxID=2908646 RepID=UPI001F3EDC0D|nr:flavin reductase family protein [Vibrio sp. SS-MA-C1-2]UJF19744.1 flavin reductase family protein [Vibrio sp. SS-MA-C1-2]